MSTPPPPPPGGNQSPYPSPPPQYGGPPPGYAPYGAPAQPQQGFSGMAIAGFVLSLIGAFPGLWFWVLQIPGYLGTIFSIVGLKQTKATGKRGRGLAIAGLVIGIIVIIAAALVTIYVYTSDNCEVDGLFDFVCVDPD